MENRFEASDLGTVRRPWRSRTLRLALGVALLFALAGDRGALTATPQGIDPFQLMDVEVKPNVLFLLDGSAITQNTQGDVVTVGGDDIQSRFYQFKRTIRKAIRDNSDHINVGLAYFGLNNLNKALTDQTRSFAGTSVGGGPLIYVASPTADAANNSGSGAGSTWKGFFTTASAGQAFANYDGAIGGICLIANCSQEVFNSFNTSENGFNSASIPLSGRYYIKSLLFRNNVRFTWKSSSGSTGLQSITTITCPQPPAGLLGDDTADSNASGTTRPCFQIQDSSGSGSLTTYYLSSGDFAATSSTCQGSLATGVAGCTQDNSAAALNSLKLEIPLAASGTPNGLPSPAPPAAATNLVGTQPNPSDPPVGIQSGGPGAIGEALQFALNYYKTVVFPARPAPAAGPQRNYVVLVTAAQPSCAADPIAAARALYTNPPTTDQIQTMVLAATTNATRAALANNIAKAGSGGVFDSVSGNYTCSDVNAATTCRDAFVAKSADDLDRQMKAIIDQMVYVGEFSDQQSITESIFEFSGAFSTLGASPLDPATRYDVTVPLLLQSTYVVPGFQGHLKAFRNSGVGSLQTGQTSVSAWGAVSPSGSPPSSSSDPDNGKPLDAGKMLQLYLQNSMGTGQYTFATLHGGVCSTTGSVSSCGSLSTSTAKIKRWILTTTRNGVFVTNQSNPVPDLVARTAQTELVPLWPPSSTSSGGVAPSGSSNPAGSLDGPLGLTGLTFSQLQSQFDACVGSNLPSGCTSGTASAQLAQAVREAREMILAFTAGAQVARDTALDQPVRDGSGNLLYQVRPWIMAESSLSAPAVMTPPPNSTPSIFADEWRMYLNGPRDSTGTAVNAINNGFGLRSPDDDTKATSQADLSLKPEMTVIFHGANDMLHAFRAGPNCGTSDSACSEVGGQELWAFVPYDLLGKLKDRMKFQERDPHTYMIAAPVRIADVFVPGSFSLTVSRGTTVSSTNGAWRTVILFGRGIGGKSVTALDVTGLGPFTACSPFTTSGCNGTNILGRSGRTNFPIILWSRGNPDTQDGTTGGTKNHDTNDYNAYLKMGQTWSVPAVSFVDPTKYVSARKSSGMNFIAYMGSGYGSTSTEGKTFFAIDPLTGDVVHSVDVPDGLTTFVANNALVASPAALNPGLLAANSTANSASSQVTAAYIGDIQGRLWKFNAASLAAPILFSDLGPSQPIGNAVALLYIDSDGTGLKPHVYVETGNDNRVDPPPAATPPFLMEGLRDDCPTSDPTCTTPGTQVFAIQFPDRFRGTVQPATTFSSLDNTKGRVFFAGTQFNPATASDCVATFDSILFAVGAATGGAAYDFTGAGSTDPRSITITGQRIQAIRTAGGLLVIDRSLSAENAPPPPAPPAGVGGSSVENQVFTSLLRGASSVCQ